MNKKLICMAVASLVALPAAAQSNVQVYGSIDMGFSHLGSGEGQGDSAAPSSRSAIDSGLMGSNRIGFRGQEDLGNGLTGFFQVETGFDGDTSSALGGNRQSLLGLRGDFGQVSLGRQYNPSRQLVGNFDPFSNDWYAAAENFYSNGINNRLNNSVIYQTPDMQGFELSLAYSRSVFDDEEVRFSGADREDERVWVVSPTYTNGPLSLGASYQRSDASSSADINDGYGGMRQWDMGAAYDFGPVEISGLYGDRRNDISGESDVRIRNYLIGASAPVGEAGTVMASYIHSRIENLADETLRGGKWSLGYSHRLSQRTNVYAVYSQVNTNSAGEGFFAADRYGPRDLGDGNEGAFESALAVGIRHRF